MNKKGVLLALWVLSTLLMCNTIVSADFTPYETLSFYCRATVLSPAPVFSNENPSNNTVDVSVGTSTLSVYISTVDGSLFNWSIETVPDIGSNSSNNAGNGTKSVGVSGNLTSSNSYTWFVNATNGSSGLWTNETYNFNTGNPPGLGWSTLSFYVYAEVQSNPPTITNVEPGNGTTGIGLYTHLNVTVDEQQGDLFNITWYENYSTGSWVAFAWNASCVNGSYSQPCNWSNASGKTIYWRVGVNDTEGYWSNHTYSFTTSDFQWGAWNSWWVVDYIPSNLEPPTSFLAKNINNSLINLTWSNQASVNYTYIVQKKGSSPSNRTDGTLVYNGTSGGYNSSSLDVGTRYYYRAWGYNETLDVFSDNSSTDDNYTSPGDPSNLHDTEQGMNTIDLAWTVGNNATRTVIVYNETGYGNYPTSPTNGTVGYNNTGSSGEISGLTANNTYYFTAWGYNPTGGFFSDGNDTTISSTINASGTPYGFTAVASNDTYVDLSWTAASDYTTILRKVDSSPTSMTDGTVVFNNSGNSYTDTGLNPTTHYYYRAWGWNGVAHSGGSVADDNITWPGKPTDFVGNIIGGGLNLSWTKGINSTRTVIRNNTGSYPVNIADGYLVANTTFNYKIVSGATNIDYFTAFAYVKKDGEALYSEPVNVVWGGLEIWVFKSTEPWIAVENYTVFITNQDGSETFQNTSQNNPTRIDVSDVPNGEDIQVMVSKDGYNSAVKYMDLLENEWYNVTFLLTPDESGGGTPGNDDYIPPSDDNESYGYLYVISVVGYQEEYTSDPVENAYVVFKQYVNTTDEFVDYWAEYTDSEGQISLYLTPDTTYKVTISKEGYITTEDDYIPSSSVFTKQFRIYPESTPADVVDIFNDVITFTGVMQSNNTVLITYVDSNSSTIDTVIRLYESYNNTDVLRDTDSRSGENSFSYYAGVANTSRTHLAVLHFNNTGNFDVSSPYTLVVAPLLPPSNDTFNIDDRIEPVIGPAGPFSWADVIAVVLPIICLVAFGVYNVGAGIFMCGLSLGLVQAIYHLRLDPGSFDSNLAILSPVIIAIAILYMWSKKRGEEML